MMQFNTIYINNINKEFNQHYVDATSTISKLTKNAGEIGIPTVDESLQQVGFTNPYIIMNGPCEWFESWSDSRININANTTIYFFLYEVLSVWQNHSRYDCPEGIIEADCTINEFDMIERWCSKHNCKFKIFTNEYHMLEALQQTRYANWAIYPLDTFSLGYCFLNREPWDGLNMDIEHKVNCFTYRWDQHRNLAVSFIHNVFGDQPITHYHDTENVIDKFSFKNSKHYNTLLQGRKSLNSIVPVSVDINNTQKVNMQTHRLPAINAINSISEHSAGLEEYYRNSFVTLACETNYEYPWGQISEKTLDPIKHGSAILLLAGPHSLELLKQWGLKTFSEFWDESYDQELNPIKRMDKVFDILLDIKQQSFNELQQIRKHMRSTLVHNRNVIRTGEIRKHITKVIQ